MGAVKLDNLASAFNFCLHRKFQELFRNYSLRKNVVYATIIKRIEELKELMSERSS